jgi:hypothetical protein
MRRARLLRTIATAQPKIANSVFNSGKVILPHAQICKTPMLVAASVEATMGGMLGMVCWNLTLGINLASLISIGFLLNRRGRLTGLL